MPGDARTRPTVYPLIPLYRKRLRFSYGLAALFALVTAVAIVAGAMKMPILLGVLFVLDAVVAVIGLYYIRAGSGRRGGHVRHTTAVRLCETRSMSAHLGFGLALLAFAGLSFALAAWLGR